MSHQQDWLEAYLWSGSWGGLEKPGVLSVFWHRPSCQVTLTFCGSCFLQGLSFPLYNDTFLLHKWLLTNKDPWCCKDEVCLRSPYLSLVCQKVVSWTRCLKNLVEETSGGNQGQKLHNLSRRCAAVLWYLSKSMQLSSCSISASWTAVYDCCVLLYPLVLLRRFGFDGLCNSLSAGGCC